MSLFLCTGYLMFDVDNSGDPSPHSTCLELASLTAHFRRNSRTRKSNGCWQNLLLLRRTERSTIWRDAWLRRLSGLLIQYDRNRGICRRKGGLQAGGHWVDMENGVLVTWLKKGTIWASCGLVFIWSLLLAYLAFKTVPTPRPIEALGFADPG